MNGLFAPLILGVVIGDDADEVARDSVEPVPLFTAEFILGRFTLGDEMAAKTSAKN